MGPTQDIADGGFWAALGLKLSNILAGAVGAFVSLRFFDGLSFVQKWATFMGGWGIAAYGGAPLREYFELKASLEVGITLLLGLFGMSLAAAIIKAVQETNWVALINGLGKAIIARLTGTKPEDRS